MTVRLLDHRHRRTHALARFFGNYGSEPTALVPGAGMFVPYAALSQFWWFLSWVAVVAAVATYVVLYVAYCVAVCRARLDYDLDNHSGWARTLRQVQELQDVHRHLPPELASTLDDSLSYCYRAVAIGESKGVNERLEAANELLSAHQSSRRTVLQSTDDLDRVKAVTRALQEQKSVQAA